MANDYEQEFINSAMECANRIAFNIERLAEGESISDDGEDYTSVYDYVTSLECAASKVMGAYNDEFEGVIIDCGHVYDTHIYIDTWDGNCVRVGNAYRTYLSAEAVQEIEDIY